jgi:hypothetical protein
VVFIAALTVSASAFAVSSKVVRQSTASDFQKGKTENVVIDSQGTIQLGPASTTLVSDIPDAWTVNTVLTDPRGPLYLGTSPNGLIYKFSEGKLTKIYPAADANAASKTEPNDSNAPRKQYLTNEHIFAMGFDAAGRVLAGISGKQCKLIRFEHDKIQTVFEPNDASYIFAITTDQIGNIYLGTGPKGNIYRLNPFAMNAELVYHSTDKNILSLAMGPDGMLYAGTDGRGLVYKIDPAQKTASVLYDSEQNEITSILFDRDGNLFAAATSASVAKGDRVPLDNPPGRPDAGNAPAPKQGQNVAQLVIPNIEKKSAEDEQSKIKALIQRSASPSAASHIYKITKEGYVTDSFQDSVVFFNLASFDDKLLVATGNKGQLFGISPAAEKKEIVYQDQHATQVTAIAPGIDNVYLGTANPARLIKLSKSLAETGTFTSGLVDAGQPAKWGKLQVSAAVEGGTKLQVSARSGNVTDINDPTYSPWSRPVDVSEPVQLDVPLGRFCQYKLIFSGNGRNTPVVREVAVPYMIPNLAPQVELLSLIRSENPDKAGLFSINYKASDRNNDKLIYKIEIRKVGNTSWIKIKDNLEADTYIWDSRTVEDGRYEVRVTASDERSNTSATRLSNSRISEQVIVDNTPPRIENSRLSVDGTTATLDFTVKDELSAISAVSYTLDSNSDWIGTLPIDSVYDTLSEDFSVTLTDLSVGEHIIAVRSADAVGNTAYNSFKVSVPGTR